ncbi:uncharacterized protein FIBRA_01160 [Fibroporia radiculosa]|uniref:RWD domain-containing protein n=1 Tax=Fibroporia radiculosa TaxID=599839 RepID=J4GJG2_9APHY|nr:uncharacterized protein FIBRA_01160 [Fibroporia radiculosa]CCL99145.1 predicted protein [Fibroporia radiculosa]
MSSEVLSEEFEVLEAIYPTELTKLSERAIRIDVEPEDPLEGEDNRPKPSQVKLALEVYYTDDYPDALPDFSLDPTEGELNEMETEDILDELRRVGRDNLGMAMTFTLVAHLREQLSSLIRVRAEHREQEEAEKERLALEAEEARTRGTPVTVENFRTWKSKFDKEMAIKRGREEDERLKGMTLKEREEYKKLGTRLTGRQLFERDKNLDISDDNLVEEGAVSVDISQYDRSMIDEEEDEAQVTFSDSE